MSARMRTAYTICWWLSLVAWAAVAISAAGLGALAIADLVRIVVGSLP